MANKKTSKKPKKLSVKDIPIYSLKKSISTKKHEPLKNLLDMNLISQALVECILKADQEGFMEVFYQAHLISEPKIQKTLNSIYL